MGLERSAAYISRVTDLVASRLRSGGPSPEIACKGCGAQVSQLDTSTCGACGRPVCARCGTILSVHYLHLLDSKVGLSQKYDEEVSRIGSCSPACAEGPVQDALASCLLDHLLEALRRSGVRIENSTGASFASSLQMNLPGLPPDAQQRLQHYRATDGPRRLPFRVVVEGLLAQPRRVETEPEGGLRIYPDFDDPTQFAQVRGAPSLLEAAERASDRGPNSPWTDLWTRSVKGVARVLSVAGRFDDAAKTYEIAHLFEEAGRERAKSKSATAVTAGLEELIKEFRNSGIVSVYRCPSCGAAIRFAKDTPDTRLQTCQYCGTTFKREDMAGFLSTILGVN